MIAPPAVERGGRASRQTSPALTAGNPGNFRVGWMRTFVSRPMTAVSAGTPERTSRHTGALLRGCVCWRSTCCSARSLSPGSASCAAATTENRPINAAAANFIRISPGTRVLVLVERARLDLAFPLGLDAALLRTVPGMNVGLALIAGRLVVSFDRALAARRQADSAQEQRDND